MENIGFDIDKYDTRRTESRKRRDISFNFREPDRVVTHASVCSPYFCWLLGINIADYYQDIDIQIHVQTWGLKWRYENLFDDFTGTGLHLDIGTTAEGVVFGCEIARPDHTTPYIVRSIHSMQDVEELQVIPPQDSPSIQQHLACCREFAERVEQLGLDIPVSPPSLGMHPPISSATAIADPDWVYMMMAAEPQAIKLLFDKCFQAFCMLRDYMIEIGSADYDSLGLCDDNSAFISAEMYKEQILPYNKALYERYGRKYRYLHTDGPSQQNFPVYADIIKLNMMDVGGWSNLQPAVDILKPAGCVIHGNMNNRDLYGGWTEDVRRIVRQMIRMAGPGGGYEFAIGGETYPGVDPDVLCRTFEYAHEVGEYPIDIPEEPFPEEAQKGKPGITP